MGVEEKMLGGGVEVGSEGGGEVEKVTKVGEAREDVDDNKGDLAEFQKRMVELKEKGEANPFGVALADIEARAEKGEATRADILALRRGAVDSASNKKDALEKHLRLAASFLSLSSGGGGRLAYDVNFGGNKMAERFVGLGDMLPANVEAVRVLDSSGVVVSERAVRGRNSVGRIGYFDEATKQYMAVHSGFKVEVLGTRMDSSSGDGVGADAELERRKLQEEMALFGDDFSEEFFAGENEQEWLAPKGLADQPPKQWVKTGGARMKTKVPARPSSASEDSREVDAGVVERGDIAKSRAEIAPGRDLGRAGVLGRGYKPAVRGLPRVVVREAHRILRDSRLGFGDEVPVNVGGREYLARVEWHKHAPSDNVSARLKDWHRGVTIYEKRG